MKKKITEANIRDYIAENLGNLIPGLTLIQKEKFIPSEIGTKSFIDILAQDEGGRYVLIEIKRTREASREALHEVLKYFESVKEHIGLREDELRVCIIAQDWKELIVPFTSLVERISCLVEGFTVEVSDAGEVVGIEPMLPVNLNDGRILAPWHELNFYKDKESFELGVKTYEHSCLQKGIESYVLVELRTPDESPEGQPSTKEITMRGMISEMAGRMGSPSRNVAPALYKYIIYFGMQQLSKSAYWDRLKKNPIAFENAVEITADMEEDETVLSLHETLTAMQPRPHNDFFEIGYPAKLFSRLLQDENWNIEKIHRYGSFSRNLNLSDNKIIDELCGKQGNSQQKYTKELFFVSNKSQLAEVRRGVKECLAHNSAWRSQINTILNELEEKHCQDPVRISIYNPSSALLTCYLAATSQNAILYIPTYSIIINPDNPACMYFGCLQREKAQPDFDEILREFYDGSLWQLMFPLQWGGYETRDMDVMRRLGLRYRSFRVDKDAEKRHFFRLLDDGWDTHPEIFFVQEFYQFLFENDKFRERVIHEYSSRWDGHVLKFDQD